MTTNFSSDVDVGRRQEWMRLLACSEPAELQMLWDGLRNKPEFQQLRPSESGLLMTRGRMGGTGDAFNLGEITVTRCSVRTEDGHIWHAYVTGRDRAHAERAAMCDAMLQDPGRAVSVERIILMPLRMSEQKRRSKRGAQVAATKVDFFTMVRGED